MQSVYAGQAQIVGKGLRLGKPDEEFEVRSKTVEFSWVHTRRYRSRSGEWYVIYRKGEVWGRQSEVKDWSGGKTFKIWTIGKVERLLLHSRASWTVFITIHNFAISSHTRPITAKKASTGYLLGILVQNCIMESLLTCPISMGRGSAGGISLVSRALQRTWTTSE